ncbi:Pantothenate transporter FEN2 [Kluyveromyces marxianus]
MRKLFKVDLTVLSFVCLQYWINYVDRIGFTNAYVSGMKTDIGFKSNQFNVANTCFTVGYLLGMIPHNLILLRIKPKIWLSFCTLVWGILTLSMCGIHSVWQCYLIRFFQAWFESCTFSGTQLILGSWYTPSQLPIRTAIFTSSGLLGAMTSGFLQVAIHDSLAGKNGMPGWKWLFIIDGLITIPIALYGLLFFPEPDADSREVTHKNSWILTGKHKQQIDNLDWSIFKRVCGRWHWWLFSFVWVLGGENISFASNSTFNIWLDTQGYSLADRNRLPVAIYAVGIVSTISASLYVHKYSHFAKHWHVAIFISVAMFIVSLLMLTNPLNPRYVFAAQYLGGISYTGQTLFFAWCNVVCRGDLQERAIVLASMNMFSGAVNAWWSLLFYSTSMAPKFTKGCYALMATSISSGIVSLYIHYLQRRDTLDVSKYSDPEEQIKE